MDWWWLIRQAQLPSPLGSSTLALPSDFERLLYNAEPIFIFASSYTKLVRRYEEPQLILSQGALGAPTAFCLTGKTFSLVPAAGIEGTVRIRYIAKATELALSATTENSWTENAFALLMAKAGIALAQALQSDTVAAFAADYASAYDEAMSDTVAREDTQFSLSRGDDGSY